MRRQTQTNWVTDQGKPLFSLQAARCTVHLYDASQRDLYEMAEAIVDYLDRFGNSDALAELVTNAPRPPQDPKPGAVVPPSPAPTSTGSCAPAQVGTSATPTTEAP
jgi:hypothetical protein